MDVDEPLQFESDSDEAGSDLETDRIPEDGRDDSDTDEVCNFNL